MQRSPASIVVVGSLNIDYCAVVERLPDRGETISATGFIQRFGGKGANQAIAAARQGATVSMIGCVGRDVNGEAYRARLRAEGIGTAGISCAPKTATGAALIAFDRQGENTIIVIAGANHALSPSMVRSRRKEIRSARIMLVQFEVPMAAVVEAIRIANRAGLRVVLNPSPMRKGFPWGKCILDTVIVNAGEAKMLFEVDLQNISALQRKLSRWRIGRIIITHGAEPTVCINASGHLAVPTMTVKPVDTVGAGDAFAGTYVALRAEGLNVLESLRYANCAGALATLKPGAQEAMPRRKETEKAVVKTERKL